MTGLLAAVFVFAADSPPVRLLWSQRSPGPLGAATQMFEVLPDGTATWTAPKRGGGCAGQGGRYRLRLTPAEVSELAAAADAALADQPTPQPSLAPRERDDTSHRIMVQRGEQVRSMRIASATPATRRFDEKRAAVIGRMLPWAAVAMSVSRSRPGRWSVRFKLLGEGPFRLFVPELADEAFRIGAGGRVSYLGASPKRTVELTKESPRFDVDLRAETTALGELTFDNRRVLHHAGGGPGDSSTWVLPLELCASLGG